MNCHGPGDTEGLMLTGMCLKGKHLLYVFKVALKREKKVKDIDRAIFRKY